MKGDGRVAGEGRVVGIPKFHGAPIRLLHQNESCTATNGDQRRLGG